MKSLTVGMVNIKVSPDMDGFKEKVEAAVKRLRAVEVDVNPDMDGFRTKVDAATKGMKAKVDVYADTKNLPGQIKKAMSRASGGKVEIDTVLRTRNRDIQRHTKELGKLLRRGAKQSAITLVTNVDWSLGGQAARQKMSKWLSRLRGQAKDTVKVLEEIEPPSIKTVQISQDNIKKIEREIQALKDLDGVRKRLNRNAKNRQYDPRLHEEFQRIERMGKALRGIKAGNATAEIDKLDDAIRRFHREVNASPVAMDRYGRRLGQIRKEFAAVEAAARRANAPKVDSPTRRIPETFDRRAIRNLRERAKRMSMYVRPIGDELKYVWDVSRAGAKKANANLRKYINSVKESSDATKTAGANLRALKVQNDEVARSTERTTRSFRKMGREVKKSNTGWGGRRRRGFKSIDEVGTERFFGLSRIGWIIAAISAIAAPLIQLVSGAVAALPALGLAAVAALGVTVLGWEGIKTAANAAVPAVNRAKEAISSVFEERLTPQFAQLGGALDHIRPNLVQLAHGMSDFSQGMVDAVSKGRGLNNINEVVGRTATLFSDLKPFAHDFTAGLLEMGAAGSRSFPKLAEGMNRFGSTFKNAVEEMSNSGALQQAIESTYTVLGSAGMNIGRILREGIETFTPEVAASVDNLFTGFADGINGLLPVFSSFSQNIFNAVGELFSQIGEIGKEIGPNLSEVFDGLGPGLTDLVSGIGDIGGAVLTPITEFLAGIAPGAGATLSAAGQGLSEFAEAVRGMDGLGDTLRSIGEGIGDFLSGTAKLNGFGHDLDLVAQQVNDSMNKLESSNSSMERWLRGFSGESGLIRAAGVEISEAVRVTFGSVESAAADSKAAMERVQDALKIDLTPRIEMVDQASTREEIMRINRETADMIREGAFATEHVQPEISIDPKVTISDASAHLTALASTFSANLGDTIAQFSVDAQAVAEAHSIDISPQIRVLESSTSYSAFREAALGIIAEIEAAAAPESAQVAPNLELAPGTGEGLGASLQETITTQLNEATLGASESVNTAAQSIGTSLGDALGGIEIPTEGLSAQFSTAFTSAFSGMTIDASVVQAPIDNALNGVTFDASGITSALTTAIDTATNAAKAAAELDLTETGVQGGTTMAAGITSTEGAVSSAATALKNAATSATAGISLFANGAAAGQSFADGINSKVGAVRAAAANLAAAVKANMPSSPAKEGPLSGKGYTDQSGIALAKDFAKGMLSQKGTVDSAAAELAGAVHKNMNSILIEPKAGFEAHHRKKVLDPVLEANAKKIHDWRKRQEEAEKKSVERIDKINEGKGDQVKKEEQIAKERERLAKSNAESYEKLLESLEEPDYGKIDRSIKGYWIDGLKEQMQLGLTKAVEDTDLAGSIRKVSLGTINALRKVMGDHPVFAQVEANVNAEHFNETVTRVIEESGIAYVPVEFVFSNLDQLKSDLGMGDGVISRAIDQALNFDPSKTDARYAQENKTEIHYHVTDMEEAIRLEQQRERKAMMKLG